MKDRNRWAGHTPTPDNETPRVCPGCGASSLARDTDPRCQGCGVSIASATLPLVNFTAWGQLRGRLVGREIHIRVGETWRVLGTILLT